MCLSIQSTPVIILGAVIKNMYCVPVEFNVL
jgi:hypothetical protein